MIGYIKGKATVVSKEFCFIEAGGIGYRVFISEMSRQKIHLGTPVRLLTYMAVREDAILLYILNSKKRGQDGKNKKSTKQR